MRKAVLDFIKLEDKPFLLSGHIDINAHLEEIMKIYDQEGRDYKSILIGDINLLLLSYQRHKRALTTTALKRTSKEKSIIMKSWKRRPPFKTLMPTRGEHESAMLHIEQLLYLLIISTKGYGLYLSDSDLYGDELKLFENLKFDNGQTFPEMVKSIYGHKQPPKQTPLDNSPEYVPPGNAPAAKRQTKKGGNGRPTAPPFRDFFIMSEDGDIVLPILHELMDGKSPTLIASYIVAITGVWINEPNHVSVCKEFCILKNRADGIEEANSTYKDAINRHYGRNKYTGDAKPISDYQLAIYRKTIQSKIEQKKTGKAIK